jgi:hypothetical protein
VCLNHGDRHNRRITSLGDSINSSSVSAYFSRTRFGKLTETLPGASPGVLFCRMREQFGPRLERMPHVRAYPKRDSHFAHRFCRVLHKSCAAQDIGRDACYLLTVIAHTEDAARYSGAVRYWNTQLEQTMGFTSPKQLNNARRVAMEAGWLVYEREHDRGVGHYFVTIPARYLSLSDSPIEGEETTVSLSPGGNDVANFTSPDGKESGKGTSNSAISLSPGGMDCGKDCGKESGKPSIPIPIPNTYCNEPAKPASSPTSDPKLSKAKKPKRDLESIEFPNFPVVGTGDPLWVLTEKYIGELSDLYPGVDVRLQARAALRWCKNNPTKIKTLEGMPRFINAWMRREQDRCCTRGANSPPPIHQPREITRPIKRPSSLTHT